jgi:hypothetical protein
MRELRASAILIFIQCGEKFRRMYIDRESYSPGTNAVRGIAVHKGASHNFSQKIKSRKDLSAGTIVEVAVETLRLQVKNEGIYLGPSEASQGKVVIMNSTEQAVVTLSTLYRQQVAPKYQPLNVEAERKVEIPGDDVTLVTHTDLETKANEIPDLKTHIRKPRDNEADESMQLTFYAMGFHAVHKEPPKALILEHLVASNGVGQLVTQRTHRQTEHYVAAVETIKTVNKAINAGIFPPAVGQFGAWWCGARYCQFHSTCKYIASHRRGKE